MPLAAGGDEGPHIGNRRVVAENCCDGVDEGAFAVCAGAIGEDEFMFACDAGGGVAAIALQEGLQLDVLRRDAVEKGRP
jgi:hypothetical protein